MDEASSPMRKLVPGSVMCGKYKLLEKIGAGSFGMVFKTQNLKNGEYVAAKFERREEGQKGVSLLVREIKVLSEVSGLKGYPQLKFYGRDEKHNFLMETYLGMNLEQLLRKCGGKFSINTTLRVGVQLLERLQAFHEKNLIHRDIKPENFTISRHDVTLVCAIDFGLAKYFRDSNGKHIPFIGNKGLIGTARYASINALQGNEQSRRDDIEALAYVLIYLVVGELPWQNIQVQSKDEKYKAILAMKQNNVIDKSKVPDCLQQLLKLSRTYEFNEMPNYEAITQLLSKDIKILEKLDWEGMVESVEDKMSVSIDVMSVDFEQQEQPQVVANSMKKIIQQDHKFIDGRLNNHTLLEVPKNSIILHDALNGTLLSINTSKQNHYQKSHNQIETQKQFSDMRIKSCDHFRDFDEVEASQDDQPSLTYKNLVICRRQSSKQ